MNIHSVNQPNHNWIFPQKWRWMVCKTIIDKYSSLVYCSVLLALKSKYPNLLFSLFRLWLWRGHCHHPLKMIAAWCSVLSRFPFPLSLKIPSTCSKYSRHDKYQCVFAITPNKAGWVNVDQVECPGVSPPYLTPWLHHSPRATGGLLPSHTGRVTSPFPLLLEVYWLYYVMSWC